MDKVIEMNTEYLKKMEEQSKKLLIKELHRLQQENEFLRERENKLQMIEQMFKSGQVDLGDLSALVEGE